MPNRVLFQWGKNHAHPFTMFVGGFVIGTLATATIAYGWYVANDTNQQLEDDNVVVTEQVTPKASASPSAVATPSPTATTKATF